MKPLPSVWCWLLAVLFQALDQVNFWKKKSKQMIFFLKYNMPRVIGIYDHTNSHNCLSRIDAS